MDMAFGILAIAVTVIAVTALAERLGVSAPLLLVLVGIGVSFVPFISEPGLSPDVVLFGLLPPLLYAAALRTSVLDIKANRRSIGYLSVLLVIVTAFGVGLVAWLILPIPFAAAFALGAVVAPPDAVAATSIARRVGLPRRLVTILEGESLINDATAITCLRVAIVALSGTVTVFGVALSFLIAAGGGLVVGLVIAWLAIQVRKRVNEPVLDTAISLLVPFAAYIPAEFISYQSSHGSGVIAVVVAGLTLGAKSPNFQSGRSRVSERLNWATIQFLLENAVFLLIGFQARRIFADVAQTDLSPWTIVGFCAAVLATVIVLRLLWVSAARVFLFRRDRDRGGDPAPPWTNIFVVGWAGLRGVVSLAAVFLIPPDTPYRSVLVLATLVVVAGTLLIQGGTLPALVRRLGLRGPDPRSDALQAATVLESATRAALERLDQVTEKEDDETIRSVRERILSRPHAMWEKLGARDRETPAEEYRRLRLITLQAEREEVLRIRRTGTFEADVIEDVLVMLDIEESMLDLATERAAELSDEPVMTPTAPEGPCDHLQAAPADVSTNGDQGCPDCAREGTTWVHLRVCLTCANVGCCDSSTARHAERHFRESGHVVMRSFEPGEDWRWCYVDERIG